jgi:hypothetical protein
VRRTVVALLLITWLRTTAGADPGPDKSPPHDPDGAARASGPDSPWIDLAPSRVLDVREEPVPKRHHKLAAALTLGGLYAGFATWTYFAWYRKGCRPAPRECTEFVWGKDRLFQIDTYAGGADKLGHLWATLGLARLGTEILYQWGGYERRTSIIVGTALSEALFLAVEFRDGYTYQMSYGDAAFNTLGAALAFAQSTWPRIDEMIDFRVQYFPSAAYRRRVAPKGDVDVAEDYSGQTYLLAFHLGAIHALRDSKWGAWSRFVDVAVGFETRGYKPDPLYKVDPDMGHFDYDHSQSIFIGLTLNAQGVFDHLFSRKSAARKLTHGLFEVFNLPFTTLPLLEKTRVPTGPVDEDGA